MSLNSSKTCAKSSVPEIEILSTVAKVDVGREDSKEINREGLDDKAPEMIKKK